MSFEHIRSKQPSAADLLSLMSLFDCQGIPEELLNPSKPTISNCAHKTATGDDRDDSESECSDGEAEAQFEDDLVLLRDYCLITMNSTGAMFEMHGLVQLSTRRWLEARGLQNSFKHKYIHIMAAAFPPGSYENWSACQRLFAHAEVAIPYRPIDNNMDLEKKWALLLHNAGWYAWNQGKYNLAERMLRKSHQVYVTRCGKDSDAAMTGRFFIARVLMDRGKWGDAEKLFVQLLEVRKRTLGEEHPDTQRDMIWLASTYREQGRLKEAEELQLQVLECRMKSLGPDHDSTRTSASQLEGIYSAQDRWELADKLETERLESRLAKLGPDHPDTLMAMAATAWNYGRQGRFDEAKKLELEVLNRYKKQLGDHHPLTVASMSQLAFFFWREGPLEEAEKLAAQVLDAYSAMLGPDHPSTLRAMHNLAFVWNYLGRTTESLELMRRCAQLREQLLGSAHKCTRASLFALEEWTSSRPRSLTRGISPISGTHDSVS
jgi:tetratricopeptide (TPR) repeat protein